MDFDYIEQGDCLELMKKIPDGSIDYVFTSPPYNRKRNDVYTEYDDTRSDYLEFLSKVIEESKRISKNAVFINLQTNYYNRSEVYSLIGKYANEIKNIVVWKKTNPTPARKNVLCNAYELFLIFTKSNVWVCDEPTKNVITSSVNTQTYSEHKAVMKYEVCEWFITHFTKEESVVLDPFLGTGTTAVACVNTNRHYIGFEISSKYFQIACDRLNEAESKVMTT